MSDVEGDNVVVTEFVDDAQIRSYQATLGQQETIELTREKWLSLTNGQHQRPRLLLQQERDGHQV